MGVVSETIEWVASSRLRTLQVVLPDEQVAIKLQSAQRGVWHRGLVSTRSREDTLTLVLTRADEISDELWEVLCEEPGWREAQAAKAADRAAVEVHVGVARERITMAAAKAEEVAAVEAAAVATRAFGRTAYPLAQAAGGWQGENMRGTCVARLANRDACKAAALMFTRTTRAPMSFAEGRRTAAAAQRAASVAFTEELGRCWHGPGCEAALPVAVLNLRWPTYEWKVEAHEVRKYLIGREVEW